MEPGKQDLTNPSGQNVPSGTPEQPVQAAETAQPTATEPTKSRLNKKLVTIVAGIILLLIAGGAAAYFLVFKNQATPSPTPTPTAESTPDPTADWKTYIDSIHNFSIKYPPNYLVSGTLAKNLADWKAAKGITITDQNNPASPQIFIEAVFDGYGPIFQTGDINAKFESGKLVIISIDKKSAADYQKMVDDGLILDNKHDLYLSKIIEYNKIPFWFQVSHSDHGNEKLEQELIQILSTFEFTK
ncbi:hypothetical protein HYT59_01435 [Candidatus Woesebacteria bacterium]|nr:hypothetical protein [Candidatus Woesebacteria bacterium]